MPEKLVQFPILGNFDFDPEEFLNLIRKKPKAYILLGLIAFSLSSKKYSSHELGLNEIYLNDSLFTQYGTKSILTAYERSKSIKELENLGIIQIRKSSLINCRIVKLIKNPFMFNMEKP